MFLVALTLVEAALTLFPSGILITGHEGDLMHMIDAGMRMTLGEVPHVDFMTPIGIVGFAPFAWFLSLGFAAGKSAVLANLLVCVLLLPATWWVGATRLSPRLAWLFGATIIVLCTALVHGNGSTSIGFSMYYNRWCWAVTFIILMTILVRPQSTVARHWVDPIIVGLGLSMLALTKMTFFVPMVPVVLFILLSSKRLRFVGMSIATGAVVAALVTLSLGVEFVLAYTDNLMAVASGGAGRSYPGLDIGGVLSDPSRLSATLVLLTAIIFFRKVGMLRQGLILLVLAPAFVYITFQNWGNDPKWLFFLILYFAVFLPKDTAKPFMGMPARQFGGLLIAVSITAAFPSIVSLASSTPRAAFSSRAEAAQIPLPADIADLWMPESRIFVTNKIQDFVDVSPEDDEAPVAINGVELDNCEISGGFIAATMAIVREIEAMPELTDRQILMADILNVGWLMGDIPRVTGAAVWYYDDQSGFDAAEFLIVPLCPLRPASRDAMVQAMLDADLQLELQTTSTLMSLYRIVR